MLTSWSKVSKNGESLLCAQSIKDSRSTIPSPQVRTLLPLRRQPRPTHATADLTALWMSSRYWSKSFLTPHPELTIKHGMYPCVAVEHGDTIPPNMKRLSPSEDEVAQLQAQIDIDSMIEHRLRLGWTDLFITARFTQADTLPQQMLTAVHTSIHSEFESHELRSFYSTSDGSRWMDLSQFEVNPYFTDLFGDCFQEFKGSHYITIKPHIQDYLRNLASSTGPSREQLIQDMFLTRPPCKVLRIYATMKSREGLQVVGSVHQTDGVRIGDLLPQLQQHCSTATELWYTRSQLLRTEIVGHRSGKFAPRMDLSWLSEACYLP